MSVTVAVLDGMNFSTSGPSLPRIRDANCDLGILMNCGVLQTRISRRSVPRARAHEHHPRELGRSMADDSPIVRGRKVRASREELNPKLARSPGKVTPMGGVAEDECSELQKWPTSSSNAEDEELRDARKDDESPMLRASTLASRPATDSTDNPEHPVARGRRERESREEVARSARPPHIRPVSTSSSHIMTQTVAAALTPRAGHPRRRDR